MTDNLSLVSVCHIADLIATIIERGLLGFEQDLVDLQVTENFGHL
jgi:hypothetical protein